MNLLARIRKLEARHSVQDLSVPPAIHWQVIVGESEGDEQERFKRIYPGVDPAMLKNAGRPDEPRPPMVWL